MANSQKSSNMSKDFKLILIGIYFLAYNITIALPAGLQHHIIDDLDITSDQYSLLYFLVYCPFFLDYFHNYITKQWFGLKFATILYSVILITGNAVLALAIDKQIYWLMLVGRTLIGFGGNPLNNCFQIFISHWYPKSITSNYTMFIVSGITWISYSITFGVGEVTYDHVRLYNTSSTSPLGITMCILTVFLTLTMISITVTLALLYKKSDAPTIREKKFIILNDFDENSKKVEWIGDFTVTFWLLTFSCFVYYMLVIGFISVSQNLLISQYGVNVKNASVIISVLTIMAFTLSMGIGFIEDVLGRSLWFVFFGNVAAMFAYSALCFTQWSVIIPLIGLVISIGCMTPVWHMVKYAVRRDQTSTAFRIVMNSTAGGCAIGTLVSGYLIKFYGYQGMEFIMMITQAVLSVLLSIVWALDARIDGLLNATSRQRWDRLETKVLIPEKIATVHTILTPYLKYGTQLSTSVIPMTFESTSLSSEFSQTSLTLPR